MITVALTGGIGCGKSTVCNLFAEYNIPVIDTDMIARELVKPGQPALDEIISYFGTDILCSDSSLNRKKLAKEVFSHPKSKQYLESILHPKIRLTVSAQLKQLNSCYVIIAIPLLIETEQHKHYDRVLVVDCDEQRQIKRTLARDNRSLNEVQSIIRSQTSRNQRLAIADEVIDNSDDLNALKKQIKQLHLKYLQLC